MIYSIRFYDKKGNEGCWRQALYILFAILQNLEIDVHIVLDQIIYSFYFDIVVICESLSIQK